MRFNKLHIFILSVICLASALLVLPTINNNINDPNMIVYSNSDEGFSMDLIWYYFSGKKRDSYQMDVDYGLEMIYLSDLARFLLSKFIKFTPGTFVLLLRWLHLVSWIGVLIALWIFVGCHFAKGWQQTIAVLLLAVRPAFAHFSNSLKPEPLVLLILIIGLHFLLKIAKRPSYKYLLLSMLCASVAFLIKFAGIFLLPAVVAAMYFGKRYQISSNGYCSPAFPDIKNSWILESLIGACLITLPFLFVLFYTRKSTGFTYCQEFGLFGSFLEYKITFLVVFIGLCFLALPFVNALLNRKNNATLKKILQKANEINSYIFIACGLFFAFLIVFGFRWVFKPEIFRMTYTFNIFDAIGMFAEKAVPAGSSLLGCYLYIVFRKLVSFDGIMLLFFVFYCVVEFNFRAQNIKNDKLRLYKRLILVIFLLPGLAALFTTGRFEKHHMLPFFMVMSILAIQGVHMFSVLFNGKKRFKTSALVVAGLLFLTDISVNAVETVQSRMYQFHQYEDIAFEIGRWWREHIPPDTVVASDRHIVVYIPPEYKNVKIFRSNHKTRAESLCQVVEDYHPRFIYYKKDDLDETPMPPLGKLLRGRKIRQIKVFDTSGRQHQRRPGDKFFVYEILD